MSGTICPDCENVVRAIPSLKYDENTHEIDEGFLSGWRVSVSRIAIYPLDAQWQVLRNDLEKDGIRVVILAEFNIGDLKAVAEGIKHSRGQVEVEASPTATNKGHAEIVPGVTAALSKKMLHLCDLRHAS